MQKNKGSLPHFYFFKIFMMALHVAMNTPLACKQPLFDRETGAVWSPNRGCLTIKQGLFAERTGIPCFSADSSLLSDQRFVALRQMKGWRRYSIGTPRPCRERNEKKNMFSFCTSPIFS